MILEAFERTLDQMDSLSGNLLDFNYWMLQNPDAGLPIFIGLIFTCLFLLTGGSTFKERLKITLASTAMISIFLVPLFLGAALQLK